MLSYICVRHGKDNFLLEMPHRLYYEFAVRAFFKQQDMWQVEKKVKSKGAVNLTNQDENILYERRLAMNDVLVYSALSLEAYINYYAMKYVIPYHNDLERSLSTINKFKIYTQIKTNRCLTGDTLKIIKKIFKDRDEIVHPKPERIKQGFKEVPKPKGMQGKIELMDLGSLLLDMNSVYNAIFDIDTEEKESYDRAPWLYALERSS